jgi:hypothetical protein
MASSYAEGEPIWSEPIGLVARADSQGEGFRSCSAARRVLAMNTRTCEPPRQGNIDVLTLYRYRVARTDNGCLYAYGFDRATAHIRIVELKTFDEASLSGVTSDGGQVQLDGYPAFDMDAGCLWATYRAEHALGDYVDVTP